MKCAMRMAGAVGVGYVLGRTRKMKMALMLVGFGVSRQNGVQGVLDRGTSLIGSSPELTKIAETVRGELVEAARSAAVSAASNRIDSLNARLQQHGEAADEDETPGGEYADDEDESGDGDDSTEKDEVADEDDAADEDAEPTPMKGRPSRRARPATAATRRRAGEPRSRTPAGGGNRKSAASRRRRPGADGQTAESAPVRRTRR